MSTENVTKNSSAAGLLNAAVSGDRLEILKVLRATLAEQISISGSSRDIASLSKQLTEVLEQIDNIENDQPGGETAYDQVISLHIANGQKKQSKTAEPVKRKSRAKDKT